MSRRSEPDMTRMGYSPLPQSLRRVLDRYRRRWRAVNFQRGMFLTLGLVAAAVALAVAADRLLRLEPALRIAALAIIGVLFAGSLVRWVLWPVVRRISDRDAAIRVGRRFPKFEEDLVSAVELSADKRLAADSVSRTLVTSVLGRIAGRATAESVDHRAAVPLRPMLLAAAMLAAVAAALVAAYMVRPESISNALARLFQPGRAVPYFSYTQLEVTPGNQVIRVGDAADVRVTVTGRVPDAAHLDGRSGGGAVRATLPCADGAAEWKSGALFDDLTYRVSAGDALSDPYRVRVVQPPALKTKSATVSDPAYAGGDEHAVENIQGTLELIDGMEIVMSGEPAASGPDAELLCEGVLAGPEGEQPMRRDAAGVLRSPRFSPHKGGEYAITLTDGYGLRSRTPDSIFVRVRPDAVPQVAIAEPGRDVMILPGERVEVAAEARDEFGSRSLVVAQRKVTAKTVSRDLPEALDAGPWQRRTLKEGGVKEKLLAAKADLDIAAMALAPGDSLEYMAEAADYAGDAAQRTGSSRIWRVTMMSEAQHLDLVNDRLRELQTELLRRAAEQRAEAARVAALAGKSAAQSSATDSSAKDATAKDAAAKDAAAAQEAKDRENAIAKSTEQVARKFDALIPEAARNPSAPTETLSELERLGREVAAVASGPMSQAAASLGQAGQGQQGQPGQDGQSQQSSLQQAEQSESQAAAKLEALARAAEKLQRMTVLARLANEADRLAARQREVKASTEATAPKTAARRPEQLDAPSREAIERLSATEKSIKTGVDALMGDIQQAAASLEYQSPTDAAAAREAAEKIETDKLSPTAEKLAAQLRQNTLFSSIPPQESVAASLADVAKILRQAGQNDPMAAITKELEEFIRRQKEINAGTEAAIRKPGADARPDAAVKPDVQGARQAGLGRDVAEQAAAIKDLAEELENFDSQSARRLDKAAGEMRLGADDLYAAEFAGGLEHGRRALAFLEEATQQLAQEGGQMGQAVQARQNMAAVLLLQKILAGQKQVNRDTAAADEERAADAARAAPAQRHPTDEIAERQSGLRQEARRLEGMLSSMPGAAARVIVAGEKMDTSREALAQGDTGSGTRVVQRQIVVALESLMADQQKRMAGGKGGGMSAAQARIMAMLRMMQMSPGPTPGGFMGGTNSGLMPANADKAGDEEWRRTHSRFEGSLSEGAEESYPVQFRDLLNSYFDRLRKEPPR